MNIRGEKLSFLHIQLIHNDRKLSISVLIAIGLVSASIILAEISLTRLFSVTIWYHFSFVAIAIAMLGMAGSAVFVHFFKKKLGMDRLWKILPLVSWLSACCSIIALSLYLSIDYRHNFMSDSMSIFRLIPTLLFFPGFYLAGIVICTLITKYASNVNQLYFSDLVCAGTAGASSVFLLNVLSGPLVFASSALLVALSSCFLSREFPSDSKKTKIISVGGFLLVGLIIVLFQLLGFFQVKYTKDYDETKLEKIYEKWSAFSRVTVHKKRWFKMDRPFGWGLSKKYKGPPISEMWMEQDASAGSTIIRTDGDLSKLEFLKWDVTAVAYELKKHKRVCVIGLGGGRDVLMAVRHGANDVVGIEINKDIVSIVTEIFADYVGHVFNRKPVKIIMADGRTYMERSEKIFDLIQISMIDSWAASVAGAYVLAENNLYTIQAFESYLERLDREGILSISRWAFSQTPGETMRVISLALEALRKKGVENPPAHIAVVKGEFIGTVLIKKNPFSRMELDQLKKHCIKMDFNILYLPDPGPWLPSIKSFMQNWKNLPVFLKQLPLDFSPPTDDRPFFFLMIKPWDAITFGAFYQDIGIVSNFVAVKTLYVLFLILLGIVLGIVIWPAYRLSRLQKMNVSSWGTGTIFLMLGLGFMMIEIPLIQKLVLILGHPIYALSVVLSTLLVFSGIGSAISKRLVFRGKSPELRLASALFLLCVILIIFFLGSNQFSHQFLRLGTGFRFFMSILFSALCGFIMGLPFPTVVFALKKQGDEGVIPWLWAVNGSASVLGSVLAFVIALILGFTVTVALGCLCYLIVAWLVIRIKV